MRPSLVLAALVLALGGCAMHPKSAALGQCLDAAGLAIDCGHPGARTGLEGEALAQAPARNPAEGVQAQK